ncbi:hypothetical protein [Burkholderia ubonensis]|uniref:hypothetical protein n=1 Tax=Burkholderia ubonensis TaxID=101571 RepID=UPI0012F787B7|nr:hypothetical protein [Burkholderia ubonensis]
MYCRAHEVNAPLHIRGSFKQEAYDLLHIRDIADRLLQVARAYIHRWQRLLNTRA